MPEEEYKLPPEVTTALPRHLQQVLDHRGRRRILRALSESPNPRTLEELAMALPESNVSSVGYHLRVLERCGCVAAIGEVAPGDGSLRLYSSTVRQDEAVMDALWRTQMLDEIG